jgi:hypothetical protein
MDQFALIESKIRAAIAETLQTDVYQIIKNVEKQHVESDVYAVYSPIIYSRRGMSGGLSADENIVLNVISDTQIEITNETPANPDYFGTTDKDLAELVEFGHGYNGYKYDYLQDSPYVYPRPFTENTVEDLNQNKQHIDAMVKGLRKAGLDAFRT